jgi:hypothetical protein
MANRYVVFYTNGDKNLASFLEQRAHSLGYTGISYQPGISVTLDRVEGKLYWSMKGDHNLFPNHELGDFEKFLTTDFYKYVPPKPPIHLNNYSTVNFTYYGIDFKAGEKQIFLSNKEVEAIYNRIKENKAEVVELDPPF